MLRVFAGDIRIEGSVRRYAVAMIALV